MKNLFKILQTLSFILLTFSLQAQVISVDVPVSPQIEDQVVAGPCYTFAVTAALESRAMQSMCAAPDLSEWFFFSDCVIGSYDPSRFAIERILEHTRDYGAVSQGVQYTPTSLADLSNCANPNDPVLPCFFDLVKSITCDPDYCKNGMAFNLGQSCQGANSNNYFDISAAPSVLSIDEVNGQMLNKATLANSASVRSWQLRTLLDQGHGIMAGFRPDGIVNREIPHAVFIYGYDYDPNSTTTTWRYKDSWQGDAGFKSAVEGVDIHLDELAFAWYLVGNVYTETDCEFVIEGPDILLCSTGSFTIPGISNCMVVWEVSNSLTITDETDTGIIVTHDSNLSQGEGIITAYLGDCIIQKMVSFSTLADPQGIHVLGVGWPNGEFCPNTVVDFEVDDPFNPPSTTYDWYVQGGTILNGQGTTSITVLTGGPAVSSLLVEVRAIGDSCESDLVSLTASKSQECDQDDIGGRFVQVDVSDPRKVIPGKYILFDMLGRVVDQGEEFSQAQSLNHLQTGVYMVNFLEMPTPTTIKVWKE